MGSFARPAIVSGVGAVSCVGLSASSLYQAALDGASGIQSGVGTISQSLSETLSKEYPRAAVMGKAVLMGVASAKEALLQSGWGELGPDDAFVLATTVGQMELWEQPIMSSMAEGGSNDGLERAIRHQPLGALSEELAMQLGLRCQRHVVTSACSAATQAIGLAAMWVRQGTYRRCLVGGVEALCRLTLSGFESLQLISKERCTPFDSRRSGINLSEAGAFLCIESEPVSRPLALISGAGFSTDAHHLAAPEPLGKGSARSIRMALSQSGLSPSDIQWVHAHGTGSLANDLAESAAIESVFSECQESAWVSSTKGIHGHPLGASGALESVLCIEALKHQRLVKTWGLIELDPQIRIRHPNENLRLPIRHILKNTLGFGGNNASLVISHAG